MGDTEAMREALADAILSLRSEANLASRAGQHDRLHAIADSLNAASRAALAALPAPAPEGVPEDRLVPDGWRVEWVPFLCGWCTTGHDLGTFPRLVPDTLHEEGAQP